MLLLFNNIEATTSFPISCSASRSFSPNNIITPKLKSCMTLTSKCPKNQIVFLIYDGLTDNVTVKWHKHLTTLSSYLILCFQRIFYFFFVLGSGIRVIKCPRLFKIQHEKSKTTKTPGHTLAKFRALAKNAVLTAQLKEQKINMQNLNFNSKNSS